MATAGDQIKRALRLLGVLADGETPSATEYADALEAMNQMLDSWSTERLSVYGTKSVTYTWPAGQVSQTIGPNGDFGENPCPLRIDPSTYYTYDGVSYNLDFVNEDQYNSIALKTATSPLPLVLFQNTILITDTNIQMKLYPVPSTDLDFTFVFVQSLTQAGSTSDTLYFPAGYMRAFAYNLACEIAPEFGIEPPMQVKRIAVASKRDLKRINNPGDVLAMPAALVSNRSRFNIYTGQP